MLNCNCTIPNSCEAYNKLKKEKEELRKQCVISKECAMCKIRKELDRKNKSNPITRFTRV